MGEDLLLELACIVCSRTLIVGLEGWEELGAKDGKIRCDLRW